MDATSLVGDPRQEPSSDGSKGGRQLWSPSAWAVALLVVVVIAAFSAASLLLRTRGAEQQPNSMWVWEYAGPEHLVEVADDLAVGRLLVWVSPGFSTDDETMGYLGRLQSQADRSGITVEALGGDPEWAQQPDLAQSWAAEVADSGLFGRIHLDVEPHALDTWPDEAPRLVDGLVDAIDQTLSGAAGLPVDVDVPYWLGDYVTSDGSDALEAVLASASSITIMAYQPDTTRILRVAQPAIDAAHAAGVPVHVGVNVAPATVDDEASTLRDADYDSLAEVVSTVADHQGVAGVAIHDAKTALAVYDAAWQS